MENLLKKLKIKKKYKIDLTVSKAEFIERLRENTVIGDPSALFSGFEFFSSTNKMFKGIIKSNGFLIRRYRSGVMSQMPTSARGKIYEGSSGITIDTEITSYRSIFIFYYIMLIVIYSVLIGAFFFSSSNPDSFVLPFIIFHAFLMFFLPIFMMRRSVRIFSEDISVRFRALYGDNFTNMILVE